MTTVTLFWRMRGCVRGARGNQSQAAYLVLRVYLRAAVQQRVRARGRALRPAHGGVQERALATVEPLLRTQLRRVKKRQGVRRWTGAAWQGGGAHLLAVVCVGASQQRGAECVRVVVRHRAARVV
jgi:hypothetical protein